jgi:uncharacterized membrane protein YvbJ
MPRTFECPACGEDVPAKAKACPHCGACEKSGWNENDDGADGLDLPEEEFDYEKFKEEEFGISRKSEGKRLLWKWTAIVLIVLFIAAFIISGFFR